MTAREHVYSYLNVLRNSGITNMFGAATYVMTEFGIDKHEARILVAEWMRAFKK